MYSFEAVIYGILALAALICAIVLQFRRKRYEETVLMVVLSQLFLLFSRYRGIRAILDRLSLSPMLQPMLEIAAVVLIGMCAAVFVEKLPRKLRFVLCVLTIAAITLLWLGLSLYLRQLLTQNPA